MTDLVQLLRDVRACQLCQQLPLGPQPLLQAGPKARILIAGQAPGRKTHKAAKPFYDASGERLRDWLGVSEAQFYNPDIFAILPMAFCFPGSGRSGDAPPPPICAETWREPLLKELPNIALTIVLGRYAIGYHLPDDKKTPIDALSRCWLDDGGDTLVLPHPSGRNNIWLAKNPWFAAELVPKLRECVAEVIRTYPPPLQGRG
ncbi:uracil-DNA glycosylase family protein [Alterisphingorhabdus coralli]|uniref:Uracil-DNA glycosylase family protein n=1 Tax=Alterisphingorhabdus coralli TaxID=3071408 RepID=A0AA97I1B6_9SPHN|nr:uracil-DNA glycosylase family protein [Parasphingorhabdus sp. SCSIO 66989]WOE74555.1 uracil-DNA glycosylase family protein [Parasphingorhabdus sp. SCSIO 66989]